MLKIALVGATGRMGARVAEQLLLAKNAELVAVLTHAESAWRAQPYRDVLLKHGVAVEANELEVSADFAQLQQADVVIDFATAQDIANRLECYAQLEKPVVLCTTGLDESALMSIKALSENMPIVVAPNTSLGMNLLASLVATASAAMGEDADIEILEAHHTKKQDAPSGSAILLGEAAAQARGQLLNDVAAYDRNGQNEQHKKGSIGFATIRGGDIVGEHTVYLVAGGERLELTHRVGSRTTFATGAIRAAHWLANRPAGFYAMKDVLGLDEKR